MKDPEVAYIYEIRNLNNNKVYVGSATNADKRYEEHKSNLTKRKYRNKYLQNAWNKNGESAFKMTVLEVCPYDERYKREQWWIDHLKASDPESGYNIVHPVRGMAPAVRRSAISKEIWERPGLKQQVAKKSAERWLDPSYKEKMTKVSLESWKDEGRMSRHRARLAKHWTDENERKALTDRNNARWSESAERENYGAKIKALWATEEYRAKQAKVMSDRWKDPEYVAKIKKARNATAADPEYRAKLSAKRKEYWAKKRAQRAMLATHNEIV